MAATCADFANDIESWPNCAVPDCPYKACISLASAKCYHHTLGSTPPDPEDYFSERRAA